MGFRPFGLEIRSGGRAAQSPGAAFAVDAGVLVGSVATPVVDTVRRWHLPPKTALRLSVRSVRAMFCATQVSVSTRISAAARGAMPTRGTVALFDPARRRTTNLGVRSDRRDQFVECSGHAELTAHGFDAEFVVPSAEVLYEGASADDDPGGAVGLEAAHWS
jgi:hypothetical protein